MPGGDIIDLREAKARRQRRWSDDDYEDLTVTAPRVRTPTPLDGCAMSRLAEETGVLERNSAYAYVMMADQFPDTCAIAEVGQRPVGFVVGFSPRDAPATWFLWQVGVLSDARGSGVAMRMLEHVITRTDRPRLRTLVTTVASDNVASQKLFTSFAKRRGAQLAPCGEYGSHLFPEGHGAETIYRISGL